MGREAQQAEAAARERANATYAAVLAYVTDLKSSHKNELVVASIAEGIEKKGSAVFAANRSRLSSQLKAAEAAMQALPAEENRTAITRAKNTELQKAVNDDRKALRRLTREEIKTVKHMYAAAREEAKAKGRTLGRTAKADARAWKSAARLTEKAQKKAGLAEELYEGQFEHTEGASEENAERAEEAGEHAEELTESLYEKVESKIEEWADKKEDSASQDFSMSAEGELKAVVTLPLVAAIGGVVGFVLAWAKKTTRAQDELARPILAC